MLAVLPGCARVGTERERALVMEEKNLGEVVQHTRDPERRKQNVLYLPARRILADEFGGPELGHLIQEMHRVMTATAGIGIAANQVGKRLQVFMIEAHPTNPRYAGLGAVPFQVFINPRIVAASPERRNFWHGCLSAVGEPRGNVATYEWVEVAAADAEGHLRQEKLSGLAAVIFQHEFRHLLGGTYLDKAQVFYGKEELDHKLDAKELAFFDRADQALPLLIDDYRVGETLEAYYERRATSPR